ncbi:hypothetical protein EV383_1711 [Pseudonocardia sediminis]|uniref:Uncharacterized protein n=1 Tax=Pseudonocardia sediminis TaxID=1397368 RepID=A0A4Q7UT07_PSEST|nr:hypothetical protein [Pseudonocardia sediminis]RZT84855.1 hypothetical protein EV383_1711 [Pseudonocardia sediminis]
MTAPVTDPAEVTEISRVAPTGDPVRLGLPAALGRQDWYGSTRFAGRQMSRQFSFAPAGQHRVIPTTIMPGARTSTRSFRGFDAVLHEAPDRSDAALVLAGPYNEATTWFGGPAPDISGINALLSTLQFVDSERGATLSPAARDLVQQPDVTVVGRSAEAMIMVRRGTEALPSLPDHAGMVLPGGELWKAKRRLEPGQEAAVSGTPHQWRYVVATPTAVMNVVLLGPESGRPVTGLSDDGVVGALSALGASWGS